NSRRHASDQGASRPERARDPTRRPSGLPVPPRRLSALEPIPVPSHGSYLDTATTGGQLLAESRHEDLCHIRRHVSGRPPRQPIERGPLRHRGVRARERGEDRALARGQIEGPCTYPSISADKVDTERPDATDEPIA